MYIFSAQTCEQNPHHMQIQFTFQLFYFFAPQIRNQLEQIFVGKCLKYTM